MRSASVLLLFCLVAACLAAFPSLKKEVYASEWTVKLYNGQSPASLEGLGFEVVGKVADLHQTYSVRHKETHARHLSASAGAKRSSRIPSHHVTAALKEHHSVEWARQQMYVDVLWRKMQTPPITDPEYADQWHLHNTGQFGATTGIDINVIPAWNQNITGAGILITTVDDGTQYTHPDLSPNYVAAYAKNYNGGSRGATDPYPDLSLDNFHGTATAGLSWAGARDGSCGAGVAYQASGTAIRLIGDPETVTDADSADAYSFSRDQTHVYSNSYGFYVRGILAPELSQVEYDAITRAATSGRGGLGSILVFSSGNEGLENGNADLKGYTNNRYIIAVGSSDFFGKLSYFSDIGCNIMVVAPGSGNGETGVLGTDIQGTAGYSLTDCQTDFQGTSASCPVASGVVALVLQANPALTWRDVHQIIATTATVIDSTDSSWTTNGAGRRVSSRYGYGQINAGAAVNAAKAHVNLPAEATASRGSTEQKNIPDNSAAGVTYTFDITQNITLETAVLSFNIFHNHSNELQITLTSPAGTVSEFAYLRGGIVVGSATQFGTQLLPFGTALTYGRQIRFDPTARITGTVRNVASGSCTALPSCTGLSGNIAHVRLSTLCETFTSLASAAQTCGATAMIVSYTINPNTQVNEYDYFFPYTYGTAPSVTIFVGYLEYAYAVQVGAQMDGISLTLAGYIYDANNYEFGWSCTTRRLIGEQSLGTWTVQIADRFPTVTGTVRSVSLSVYGHYEGGVPSTSGPSDTSSTSGVPTTGNGGQTSASTRGSSTNSISGTSTTTGNSSASSLALSGLVVLLAALFML